VLIVALCVFYFPFQAEFNFNVFYICILGGETGGKETTGET